MAGQKSSVDNEAKYKKSLKKNWFMRFQTRHPEGDNYDGIVTQIKSEFIVMRGIDNFEVDGVLVIPKKSIKGFRDEKFERCYNQILRENKVLKKVRSPLWLNACETLADVMAQFMKRDIWPVIEVIRNKNAELYIGPITDIAKKNFHHWCYDATGKWENEYELRYNEIFRIEFNDKYSNYFNAYMRRHWVRN
jgi:hypothetical protein